MADVNRSIERTREARAVVDVLRAATRSGPEAEILAPIPVPDLLVAARQLSTKDLNRGFFSQAAQFLDSQKRRVEEEIAAQNKADEDDVHIKTTPLRIGKRVAGALVVASGVVAGGTAAGYGYNLASHPEANALSASADSIGSARRALEYVPRGEKTEEKFAEPVRAREEVRNSLGRVVLPEDIVARLGYVNNTLDEKFGNKQYAGGDPVPLPDLRAELKTAQEEVSDLSWEARKTAEYPYKEAAQAASAVLVAAGVSFLGLRKADNIIKNRCDIRIRERNSQVRFFEYDINFLRLKG